jgi:hypothetical protein
MLIKYACLKQIPYNNSRVLCKRCNKLFTIYNGGENYVKIILPARKINNFINRLVKVSGCLNLYQVDKSVRQIKVWLLT